MKKNFKSIGLFLCTVFLATSVMLSGGSNKAFAANVADNGVDQYTKLMMHMDDGTFKDECGHTVTNNGVTLDTTTKKFGNGSAYFNGSSMLTIPNSIDWNLNNTPFTIEFYINSRSYNGFDTIISQVSNNNRAWIIQILNNGRTIRWYYTTDGTTNTEKSIDFNLSTPLNINTFYHIALVYTGTNLLCFANGNLIKAVSVNLTNMYRSTAPLTIGTFGDFNFSNHYINAYIDELRISNIARWTSNFTPPVSPYGNMLATGLSLNKTVDTLNVGQADTLTATVTPDNATNKTVKWTSSDPSIATVDENGKVTAVKAGTATITATTQDGSNLSASCTVNVANPTTVSLNKTTDSINVGETDTLSAAVNPSNVGSTWSSSDSSIATVDANGKITGVKAGQATITVTTADGKTATCLVTVTDSDSADKAALNITMTNGQVKQYNVTMNEVNKFISWYKLRSAGSGDPFYEFDITQSSNPSIVRTDYVIFDKISSFEVDDYTK